MSIWQSIILGLAQGVAEFLPISSSGHLVILQNLLEINPPPIDFDIYLHLISVVVIIYYFRKSLLKLTKQQVVYLLIATMPLVIAGFFLRNMLEPLFNSNLVAGFGLILTALFNFMAAKKFLHQEKTNHILTKSAVVIGVTQAVALIPGVSRSGSTLFGAGLNNIEKKEAFDFSFMLAIFAILAASSGQLLFLGSNNISQIWNSHWSAYLVGGSVCFAASLISLKLLKLTLKKTKYHFFGWYCLAMAAISIYLHFHY
jgi:undecaprenyl-diphosphatase